MKNFQTYFHNYEGRQEGLAESLGISRCYLSLLLAGKKLPSLALALRIEAVTDGAVPASSWKDSIEQREGAE